MFIRRNERILISNNSARQNYPMKKSTNSARPAFWNQRYASGETPWVLHKIPAILRSFLTRTRRKGRVLISGCGTDHGVIKVFVDGGFEVTAIDFSPVVLAETKKALGNFDGKIMCADFCKSDFGRRFDLVYERAFLCAMHPRRWPLYAKRVAELLRPGGKFIGIFFTEPSRSRHLIRSTKHRGQKNSAKYFRLLRDLKVSDSVPMFAGMERWQEWERAAMK
jgi:SAM-dependent methyltransferase